jgi:exopolyphosphatase/guanosine-5'-triphosphate,3'-diphosphate pyrophosphatase
MTQPERIVAAIDIGSNTLKLTVAKVGNGLVKPVYGDAQVVRLSTGLAETGRLREDRIELAITALRAFTEEARANRATEITAVATEATRSAENGPDFLDRVRADVGIDVQVIDGDEEARLTSDGVLAQIDRSGRILIADIGGASTELIATRDGNVLGTVSLGIGSGIMTDQIVPSDPPRAGELDRVEQAAADLAGAFLADHGEFDRIILVGGVGSFLLALVDKAGIVPASVLDDARRITQAVSSHALAPAVNAPVARARVLPAGFAIARAICRLSAAPAIESVANGLRIGILLRIAGSGAREETPR